MNNPPADSPNFDPVPREIEVTKLPKSKILFIQSDRAMLIYCRLLLDEQYCVVVARDCHEGLDLAASEAPDLILIDLGEEADQGLALCGKILRGKATRKIPLIVLYDMRHRENVGRARKMGVVDHIPKPIIPTLFLKRIQTALERYSRT